MDKKYTQQAEEKMDDSKLESSTTGAHLGGNAFLDLTDRENDEVRPLISPIDIFWILIPCFTVRLRLLRGRRCSIKCMYL